MRDLLILFRPFIDLCLLRVKPQDLPVSGLLLGLALLAYTLSSALVSTVSLPAGSALLAGTADTALLSGLTFSVLRFQHLHARAPQTLTALAGTGALLGVLSLPVTSWLHGVQRSGGDIELPVLLLLVILVWSVVVVGHILRHALSTPYIFGLVLAVVFYWVSFVVLNAIFPAV